MSSGALVATTGKRTMTTMTMHFLAVLRANADAWQETEIDFATFTACRQDTWEKIRRSGAEIEHRCSVSCATNCPPVKRRRRRSPGKRRTVSRMWRSRRSPGSTSRSTPSNSVKATASTFTKSMYGAHAARSEQRIAPASPRATTKGKAVHRASGLVPT